MVFVDLSLPAKILIRETIFTSLIMAIGSESMKIKSRKLSRMSFHENFTPQNFLTIRYAHNDVINDIINNVINFHLNCENLYPSKISHYTVSLCCVLWLPHCNHKSWPIKLSSPMVTDAVTLAHESGTVCVSRCTYPGVLWLCLLKVQTPMEESRGEGEGRARHQCIIWIYVPRLSVGGGADQGSWVRGYIRPY